MKDYEKLKQLLESQERFPVRYTFKFVGRNSDAFARAVSHFEGKHPHLRHEQTRESSGGKHVAKTYVVDAQSAEAIIEVYRAIELIEEVLVVL
jgi:putative lipoic acid-binding regulatory protein